MECPHMLQLRRKMDVWMVEVVDEAEDVVLEVEVEAEEVDLPKLQCGSPTPQPRQITCL